jgi:hypothetical protein
MYARPILDQILTDIQDPDLSEARIANPKPKHLLFVGLLLLLEEISGKT